MTPKEKAQELYDLMRHEISQNDTRLDVFGINFIAKQCALITVDELIQFGNESGIREPMMYWQKVKQKIEKI